ncbi:MAG: Gfo/Idh/MocA family oxidoreductase [Candidatus Jordarchaeaceae archaeon]
MNIGLIGCGRVSEIHMLAYKYIPEVVIKAVVDIDVKKAKAFAEKYGIKNVFDDYVKLFELKDLDYVDICTPTSTHAQIAIEAAKFGQNILLEKPMARTTKECEEIIYETSKHHVKLCICHNQLFLPTIMQLKTLLNQSENPITYFRVSIKENSNVIGAPNWILTTKEGGILWETGTHAAYLQLHFLREVNEVFAMGDKIKHPVHDNFIAILHTPNKALGVIEVSWLAKKPEITFDFMFSDGKRIQILDYINLVELAEKYPKNDLQGFYWDVQNVIKKWSKIMIESLRKKELLNCIAHYNLISKYIQSLKEDLEPPVKPYEGKKTIELLECIEKSLDENQIVRIKI